MPQRARRVAASASSSRARVVPLRKGARPLGLPLTVSRPELLVGGRDRQFRLLVHGLLGFAAHHERIRAGHARMIGLAGIEYTVLIAIAHLSQDADVAVKSVAEHLYLSGAFITAVVKRLLRRGLIDKEVDPRDRRRVTLTVADKGRAALQRLAPMQRRVNDIEFGCLSRREFDLLTGLVDRLIDSGARAVALQSYLLSEVAPGGRRHKEPAP
ncbi:MAG: winged helix-turn-helix transcriptional regulator [Hyphomicrobiales bacterium]|nr:winged helix-turn-helix transcriptional regulator [Hyphomicrobiales bacterium]